MRIIIISAHYKFNNDETFFHTLQPIEFTEEEYYTKFKPQLLREKKKN